MKKIYSVIAAAAVGSLISASAFSTLNKVEKILPEPHQVDICKLKEVKNHKHTPSFKGVSSRAGQIDITTFTQALCYDDYLNWNIAVPGVPYNSPNATTKADSFRDLLSGNATEIVDNGDGSYTMVGLNGYDQFSLKLYVREDGRLVAKAGESIGESNGYNFVLAAFPDEDEAGNPIVEDGVEMEGGIIFSGDIPFTIYSNAMVPECMALGGFAIDPLSGDKLGWGFVSSYCGYYAPNATLTYDIELNDGTMGKVNNRVYVEFSEGNANAPQGSIYSFDRFTISNICPENSGIAVNLLVVDDIIVSLEAIAAESSYAYNELGQIINTGDMYFSYFFPEDNKEYFIYDVVGAEASSETTITWPAVVDGMTQPEITGDWGILSEIGYGYVMSKATLTIGNDETEGITDVITDNADNAPAVYYNLQGVQVANPAAGQIYIVKNGNKVTKQIIK